MARMENCVLTNMCMVVKGDEILVQERKKKDWPGITFPGGHIEKGESFRDAVIREVYEETGLLIKNPVLCGMEEYKKYKDEDRYLMFFYRADEFEGEIRDSVEGHVFWLKRSEFMKQELSEDLDRIIEVMENGALSEIVYYLEDGEWFSKVV